MPLIMLSLCWFKAAWDSQTSRGLHLDLNGFFFFLCSQVKLNCIRDWNLQVPSALASVVPPVQRKPAAMETVFQRRHWTALGRSLMTWMCSSNKSAVSFHPKIPHLPLYSELSSLVHVSLWHMSSWTISVIEYGKPWVISSARIAKCLGVHACFFAFSNVAMNIFHHLCYGNKMFTWQCCVE